MSQELDARWITMSKNNFSKISHIPANALSFPLCPNKSQSLAEGFEFVTKDWDDSSHFYDYRLHNETSL